MGKYSHLRTIGSFRGIDLRSSDVLRPNGFASDGTKNVIPSPQGGVMTRPGAKMIASTYASLGLARFESVNILGTKANKIIGFGADSAANSAKPYELNASTITFTNSHATLPATVSHYYDEATSQFRFKIVRGGSTLIDQALGVGTEGSPYTLTSLRTAVNALTSFSMSAPGSTVPAAFLEVIADEVIAANGGTLTAYHWYWSALNVEYTPSTDMSLINYAHETGLDTFRNVSAVVLQNCLYISSGVKTAASVNGNTPVKKFHVMKYDGNTFTNMGMAQPYGATGAVSNSTGTYTGVFGTIAYGSTVASGRTYQTQPIWVDKAGNEIEGDLSPHQATSSGAAAVWRLALTTSIVSYYGSGRAAHVNGAATTLTPTVDSGHTLRAGDIAFFFDKGQGRCIQREITATASTSITLSATPIDMDVTSPTYDDGSTPQFYDNANITNNMRVRIWATKTSGGEALYFMDDVPYSADCASLSYEDKYYDAKADAALVDEYIAPVYARSSARADSTGTVTGVRESFRPAGRYLSAFNQQLIVSGDDQRPNVVYFSDTDGPEYFPPGTHEFELPFPVTGHAQCGEFLMVFSEDRDYLVSGDLGNFNFRVDEVGQFGCVSHHSIKKIDEGVITWMSKRGPVVSFGGRRIEPLGALAYPDGSKVSRIEPFFTQRYAGNAVQPALKRTLAAVMPKDRLVAFFVPLEDPAKPSFAGSTSVLWVFDLGRGSWWKWDGWNCAGGMTVLDDVLYFAQRAHNGSAGTTFSNVTARAWQQQTKLALQNASDLGKYNFGDHNTAISWNWTSHWESLGEPGLFKRFLRVRPVLQETRPQSSTAFTLTTYVDYDTTATSFTDTFTVTTDKRLNIKIKSETCQAMQFAFSGSSFYQRMILSGFELEAVANFRPEYKE